MPEREFPICPGCGKRHMPHGLAYAVARGDEEHAGSPIEIEGGDVTIHFENLRDWTLIAVAIKALRLHAENHGDQEMMERTRQVELKVAAQL